MVVGGEGFKVYNSSKVVTGTDWHRHRLSDSQLITAHQNIGISEIFVRNNVLHGNLLQSDHGCLVATSPKSRIIIITSM